MTTPPDNAAFIAAANPRSILDLLDIDRLARFNDVARAQATFATEATRVDIEFQALRADIGRYVKIVSEQGARLAAIEAQHVDCRTCGAFSHCYNVVVDPECDAGSKYQAKKITQLYKVAK